MDVGLSYNDRGQVISPTVLGLADHLPALRGEEINCFFKLRDGCKFYPFDSGQDKQEFILSTPDNRQFKVSPLAKGILQRLDGSVSLEEIVLELRDQSVLVSVQELRNFLESQYVILGILEMNGSGIGDQVSINQSNNSKFSLLLHWSLVPAKYVQPISDRLRLLYNPVAVTLGLLSIVVAHFLVYYQQPALNSVSNTGSLWALLLCLTSVLCHEFGHASALSKFGGAPGPIGFGLYLLLPSFYADVSEVWRFRRNHRMVVDLGGIYFQELVYVVFAVLGLLTHAPQYFLACHFIDLMVLLNLNPVFRFDGYWFLVDYLSIPNLHSLALKYVRQSIRKAVTISDSSFTLPPMHRHTYILFVIYAALANFFLLFAVRVSYRYLNLTTAQLPQVFSNLYYSIKLALVTYDLPLLMNRLIVLFFAIAFPGTALVGLCKYAVSVGRYCIAKFQGHKPAQDT